MRDVRTQRPHRERHHVHRAATHATVKQRRRPAGRSVLQDATHLLRCHPVIGGAGVFLFRATYIGAVFHSRHVTRVGPREVGVGALGWIEFAKGSRFDQLLAQAVVFVGRPVAPVNLRRFGQRSHFADPCNQCSIAQISRGIEAYAEFCSGTHEKLRKLKTSARWSTAALLQNLPQGWLGSWQERLAGKPRRSTPLEQQFYEGVPWLPNGYGQKLCRRCITLCPTL